MFVLKIYFQVDLILHSIAIFIFILHLYLASFNNALTYSVICSLQDQYPLSS